MIIEEIPIEKIKININNPRKEFDKESLKELSSSIQSRGLINPISVKKVGDGYELICGERRLKAFKLAGIKKINAIIREYNSQEDEMAESLIENLHRTDLNSIEKENFITKLWETRKYKDKRALARALGYISEGIVADYLLAKDVREKTNVGIKISTRAIRDVAGIENIEDKKQIFNKVEKGEINSTRVREVANIMNKSQKEVKQAFYSNKISIEQADKISNIKDEKTRRKMILAHKNIKNIDRSIEKNFEKLKIESKKDLIKTKEVIDNFRSNAIENQKITQRTIGSLLKCINVINLMDDNQLKKLKHFQDLFETNISNVLQLSENLKEKIRS
jgi:ParB family chromosome partitioning protein